MRTVVAGWPATRSRVGRSSTALWIRGAGARRMPPLSHPMRTLAIPTLLAVSGALLACSDAHFSRIEREDAAATAEDAPTDTVPARDLPPDPLVCEAAGDAVCTPAACESVCHRREGAVSAGGACTVSYGTHPARYDDCAVGAICLSDGFGTSHCFGLCRTAVDCPGRACTARPLSGETAIRVCDPPYHNCSSTSEPCCDPLSSSGCGADQYCYLVSPQPPSLDSWTVCEYVTGGTSVGQLCTSSRECLPGLACYLSTPSATAGECRQVCNPALPDSCATGTCTPYGTQWGVCSR